MPVPFSALQTPRLDAKSVLRRQKRAAVIVKIAAKTTAGLQNSAPYVLFLGGAALFSCGFALWSVPLGLVVGGALMMVFGYAASFKDEKK